MQQDFERMVGGQKEGPKEHFMRHPVRVGSISLSPATLEIETPEWSESLLALECACNLDEEDERAGTIGYV